MPPAEEIAIDASDIEAKLRGEHIEEEEESIDAIYSEALDQSVRKKASADDEIETPAFIENDNPERSAKTQEKPSEPQEPVLALKELTRPAPRIDQYGREVAPIAPLDSWSSAPAPAPEVKKTEEVKVEKNEEDEQKRGFFFDEDEEVEYLEDVLALGTSTRQATRNKPVRLSKQQKKRIEEVRERIRQRALDYRKDLWRLRMADRRGSAEASFCGVNFNNYGTQSDVNRLLRGNDRALHRKKERSLLKQISRVGCSVVAVQGIMGKDRASATEAMRYFAERLSEDTEQHWESFVGDSNHKLAYNGFLVNTDRVSVINFASHTDKLLPRFGPFQEKKFLRSPVQLAVRVSSEDGSSFREFILITTDLQKALVVRTPEKEIVRMQQAEAVRQLVEISKRETKTVGDPIVILFAERNASRYSATAKLIEGTLYLTEFRNDRNCTLAEDQNGYTCNESRVAPKELFGLLSEGSPAMPDFVREKVGEDYRWKPVDPKALEKQRPLPAEIERTTEIYMRQADLPYAWRKDNSPGRYAAFSAPVDNGLEHSPFVWVVINW